MLMWSFVIEYFKKVRCYSLKASWKNCWKILLEIWKLKELFKFIKYVIFGKKYNNFIIK